MSGYHGHHGGGRGGGRGGRGQQQYQQPSMPWGQQGSGGGGGGRGGRGGGGRGAHRFKSNGGRGAGAGEPEIYQLCTFFARGGSCRNEGTCRFAHVINAFACTQASTVPIKTVALAEINQQLKLLTGGTEPCLKVWNFTTGTLALDSQPMVTAGPIESIEVSGQTISWSVEEAIPECPPETLSGTVYMMNGGSTLPVKREDVSFTHQQRVNCIVIVEPYVVTAGLEGLIRAWQFLDGKFQQVALLEGHTRSVTSLLYCAPYLWSGSLDASLRVWDVATGRCAGCIPAGQRKPDGHTHPVVCLEAIPAATPEAESMVASGDSDGWLRLWSSAGQFYHAISHGVCITALQCFQDNAGGQMTLIVGLFDGRIILRSCSTMNILFTVPSNVYNTRAVWSIVAIPNSGCFATGGDDGQLIIWQVRGPLVDSSPT